MSLTKSKDAKKAQGKQKVDIKWTNIKNPKFALTLKDGTVETTTLQKEFSAIYTDLHELKRAVSIQGAALLDQRQDIVGLQGRASAANEEITHMHGRIEDQEEIIRKLRRDIDTMKLGGLS